MSWLQISIKTTKNHIEQVEDCLFSAGAQTVTLTDAADQPILEPGPDEIPVWDAVTITGLFSSDNVQPQLSESIRQCLGELNYSFTAETLEDQDWTRTWMEHYRAMQFGDRLWVCPLHIEPPEPDAINLRLDPGLAFGTGTHPTTALCLSWLDRNILSNGKTQQTLLDYGCGSGILAIAACLLGVNQADGVDIDPQALTATISNAETNGVADKIATWLPAEYQQGWRESGSKPEYDIVVANILSGPLAELAPELASHTRTGGDIVLSGILREQAESVLAAYRDFFIMDEPVFQEDWVLLHGIKT